MRQPLDEHQPRMLQMYAPVQLHSEVQQLLERWTHQSPKVESCSVHTCWGSSLWLSEWEVAVLHCWASTRGETAVFHGSSTHDLWGRQILSATEKDFAISLTEILFVPETLVVWHVGRFRQTLPKWTVSPQKPSHRKKKSGKKQQTFIHRFSHHSHPHRKKSTIQSPESFFTDLNKHIMQVRSGLNTLYESECAWMWHTDFRRQSHEDEYWRPLRK